MESPGSPVKILSPAATPGDSDSVPGHLTEEFQMLHSGDTAVNAPSLNSAGQVGGCRGSAESHGAGAGYGLRLDCGGDSITL